MPAMRVRRSHHRKWLDLLWSPLHRQPYRCRTCRARFYAESAVLASPAGRETRRSHKSERKRGRRRIRPWMWEAALFAILLLLFLLFLRYLTHEPAPAPEGQNRTRTNGTRTA